MNNDPTMVGKSSMTIYGLYGMHGMNDVRKIIEQCWAKPQGNSE